ncbi:hypothetical protein [Streptomyces sp. NPDC058665]|uniref:hypothetical protein n=1 Tax=Streptomyces sp. NPDC058665 TaxID=3346586 RepID=UPI00364DA4BB
MITPARRAASYLPAAVLAAAATALSAYGWSLAALMCAGVSGITYAHAHHLRTTPVPTPVPAAVDGPGLRDTDARTLHARYTDAIAIEQHRQAEAGISPQSPESAQCLAAAILADREAVMETLLNDRADDEAQIDRLADDLASTRSAIRQARNHAAMWENTVGPDAPGLKRASAELTKALDTSA